MTSKENLAIIVLAGALTLLGGKAKADLLQVGASGGEYAMKWDSRKLQVGHNSLANDGYDSQDIVSSDPTWPPEIRIFTSPYGTKLETDVRGIDSKSVFNCELLSSEPMLAAYETKFHFEYLNGPEAKKDYMYTLNVTIPSEFHETGSVNDLILNHNGDTEAFPFSWDAYLTLTPISTEIPEPRTLELIVISALAGLGIKKIRKN